MRITIEFLITNTYLSIYSIRKYDDFFGVMVIGFLIKVKFGSLEVLFKKK